MKRFTAMIPMFALLAFTAWPQTVDAPLSIELRLFSISKAAMDSLMDEGLTRAELSQLQSEYFKSGVLFENETPIPIAPGTTDIEIPKEKLEQLRAQAPDSLVVFFYDIARSAEVEGPAEVARRSYSLQEHDGSIEKIREKQGKWVMPRGNADYRFMDYRFGNIATYQEFFYELHVKIGGDAYEYTLHIDMTTD